MSEPLDFFTQMTQGWETLQKIQTLAYRYNPRELVYQCDKVKLYHYAARNKSTLSQPLLIVFATVNRPEILDLMPEQSFIGNLLANGVDVYLLDWGYPDADDQEITISDYVSYYLHYCVKFILRSRQIEKINLLGICQGGLLSLCYALIFSHIKNLILISVPIDFKTAEHTVGNILSHMDITQLRGLSGNISGQALTQFFISLRPIELINKKYLNFVDNLDDEGMTEKFLYVEKWLHDAPDQAAAAFVELISDFYQGNKLIQNQIAINGRKLDLAKLTIPVLNIMGSEDEIVPMSASKVLPQYIHSSDYQEAIFPNGHIGIYISSKVGSKMAIAIAEWLNQHDAV